jgi:hypothetical protein
MSGAVDPSKAQAIALAARYGEVSILAAEASPLLAAELRDAVTRQRRLDAVLELGLAHAADALHQAGLTEVALLKGRAAAAWAYPDTASRFRRDIDLLVGPALGPVREALLAKGWRDDSPHADPSRGRTASLVLTLGLNTVSLDLHRSLVHSDWCRPDPSAILAGAVRGKAPLPVTAPIDTLLHTALHLVGNGFHEPLKGWLDLMRLLPLVDAADLETRARAFGLGTTAWLALTVLARWFGLDTSRHTARVAPSAARQALLRHLAAGDHATPERQPLPRALSWRLWRRLVHDSP